MIFEYCTRVSIQLRAFSAMGHPFVAMDKIEICTMTCDGPTIMQCPYDRNLICRQEIKPNGVIQEIAMNVMKMNDVGRYLLYCFQKTFSCLSGA